MKLLLLLPLLLGFSVPAIAHNEANGGEEADCRGLGGVYLRRLRLWMRG